MFDEDVKLPFDTVLLDDPDLDPEVRAIIERVQAKAAAIASQTPGNRPPAGDLAVQGGMVSPERVTILLKPETPKTDGRSRRKKYASRAEQQRAYRERKAAPQASTAA
jgi:hypothetical protein